MKTFFFKLIIVFVFSFLTLNAKEAVVLDVKETQRTNEYLPSGMTDFGLPMYVVKFDYDLTFHDQTTLNVKLWKYFDNEEDSMFLYNYFVISPEDLLNFLNVESNGYSSDPKDYFVTFDLKVNAKDSEEIMKGYSENWSYFYELNGKELNAKE